MRKILLTVLFLILSSFTVYAEEYSDTTSDLLSVYNKTSKIPSREEMNEFSKMLTEYNNLVDKQKKIERYNESDRKSVV